MKEKLLVVLAAAVVSSVVAVAASVAARAASAPAPVPDAGLTVVAEDRETRVYSMHSEGHLCFVAITRGGSGISVQCPR